MTEAEAMEILDNECEDPYKIQIALKVARLALKKQIAKKPIVQGLGQRYCPICRCGGANHQYCARCGQKLDSEV